MQSFGGIFYVTFSSGQRQFWAAIKTEENKGHNYTIEEDNSHRDNNIEENNSHGDKNIEEKKGHDNKTFGL